MILIDRETGHLYEGHLRLEVSYQGQESEVLATMPTRDGGEERRVLPKEAGSLFLVSASVDEVSRLDRAGYRLETNLRGTGRRAREIHPA